MREKRETLHELFCKVYKVIYSSQHSLNVMYNRFNRHDISNEVANSADRLVRSAYHKDYISSVEEECPHITMQRLIYELAIESVSPSGQISGQIRRRICIFLGPSRAEPGLLYVPGAGLFLFGFGR